MISLATIHEDKITRFQRHHYIISVSELQNKASIGHDDIQCEEHISIETVRNLFPKITTGGIAHILSISIARQLQAGQRRFLLTFTDETKRESLDLLYGLVNVLQIEPSTDEQRKNFELMRTHAGEWTEELCRAEGKYHNIANTLKRLREMC